MSDFDFNITIPKSRRLGGAYARADKYGFSAFPLGASKFFPEAGGQFQSGLHSCAKQKNPTGKFVTRTVEENGVMGTRIWRTA